MKLFKYSIIILVIIAVKMLYAEQNTRNSTRKFFKYIISDGVQDFAMEN